MVDVDAPDVVAVLGEAGPGDEADVPGSDDADFHGYTSRGGNGFENKA